MNKVYKNINQLDKYFDKKYCRIIEGHDAIEKIFALAAKYKLNEGFYISFKDYEKSRLIKIYELNDITLSEHIVIFF